MNGFKQTTAPNLYLPPAEASNISTISPPFQTTLTFEQIVPAIASAADADTGDPEGLAKATS